MYPFESSEQKEEKAFCRPATGVYIRYIYIERERDWGGNIYKVI